MLKRMRFTGLWRHANFLKLWIGSTISLFGSQVTFLAIPFLAAITLHAAPLQMGLLSVMETAPVLLGGLFAGVWVDRMRRRPLLIVADIGRALLLGSIPLAALFHLLHIEYLYAVIFATSMLSLFFNVAYEAFMPTLIGREQLSEGNSKLQTSVSLTDFAGPGLAGILVQLFTAPFAILIDACSFLASAVFLYSLRVKEEVPPAQAERRHFWRELGEGLRFLFSSPLLGGLAASAAVLNFTGGVFAALLALYFTRDLHLGAASFGLMYTVGSLSGIVGALTANWLTQRLGAGKLLCLSALFIAVGWLCVPIAQGSALMAMGIIVGGALIFGIGNTTFNVTATTVRQLMTPDWLMGRVNSCGTFIALGALPLGALSGGLLGIVIGSRLTLLAAALIRFVLLIVCLVPLWRHKEKPVEND
jgi:MFS family permease